MANKPRPLVQLDCFNNKIAIYERLTEAADATGFTWSAIWNALRSPVGTHGGYKWRYVDEYLIATKPAPLHPYMIEAAIITRYLHTPDTNVQISDILGISIDMVRNAIKRHKSTIAADITEETKSKAA